MSWRLTDHSLHVNDLANEENKCVNLNKTLEAEIENLWQKASAFESFSHFHRNQNFLNKVIGWSSFAKKNFFLCNLNFAIIS
jgi:hypothetical protein